MKGWGRTIDEYVQDVDLCDPYLGGARLFRPPYGRIRIGQWLALARKGYKVVLWHVLTKDYSPLASIGCHDWVKAGQKVLEVLPEAIAWLKKEGYEFKTL